MKQTAHTACGKKTCYAAFGVLAAIIMMMAAPFFVQTQEAPSLPAPVVAIHVSELTAALESIPNAWWPTWHYFVGYESLKEALRSDGTSFVTVSDADIAANSLLYPDGSPKYPILISLASEAIADNEVAPLRDYVAAGGFLVVGSSAFTRNPDGTTRGDFALADEMGLHMANPTLENWYENLRFSKVVEHRLATGIPAGTISWRMPRSSEEVPLGVSPSHSVHGYHYVFSVTAAKAAKVIAAGDSGGPLLATTQYGKGNFIYHGAAQPLIGHTVYDPSMYAYLIYRNAIAWAFEAANLPIIKLSPWQYDYNAAFVVRHDFENYPDSIRSIESSAAYEHAVGVKGDYYFCTGTLRQEMADKNTVIGSLRRAVTNYGATIGSHNGGLKNPVNSSLVLGDFDYWHWGSDEALDVKPAGYASGKAYAQTSISNSFQDIEGWLAGVDNGRPGCGAAGNCPRIWASPYFNSAREDSYDILQALGAASMSMGEQKIGPFPHWTISYRTPGKRYSHVSEPASEWYVGTEVPGAIEWGHTSDSMEAAVDFYYNLGAMINLYGHLVSSDSTLIGQYVNYCASKPRMWSTNAAGITNWWKARSAAVVTPAFSISGNTAVAGATITGATDPGTAIEVAIPGNQTVNDLQVFLNGAPADPADYRTIGNTVKVLVGTAATSATVQYTINTGTNPAPTLTGMSPTTAFAGDPGFTLTVTGTGFITGSTVRWNGASRTTTYRSSTRLTAAISSADIASAGTASVTVFNPAPGGGASNAQTFTISSSSPGAGTWTQTSWVGGGGQSLWTDATRYDSAGGIDGTVDGQISLATTSTVPMLFSDDFTRSTGSSNPLSPWVAAMGTWTVTGGVMQGSGNASQYSYASYSPATPWADYSLQGSIQLPAGSFGGGIGGRVDPATGSHYGAWVYPAGSLGGSNFLKLWKFRSWTDIGAGVPMQQVILPDVGTGWHTLRMDFLGDRILVYYDGGLKIDVTDNNYDSRAPYLSGGISADWWTSSPPYTLSVDAISVAALTAHNSSGVLLSSAFDGGDGVQWQDLSWDAAAGAGTNVCVRTRTAVQSDQLVNSPWSDCYGSSGSGLMSPDARWIQYQLGLSTTDPSTSPVFNEIRISYFAGTPGGALPVISSLAPASAPSGGPAFTLIVNGTGFVNDSAVQWNGANRTTTYVSSTQLTAAISAADIVSAGTATVTVFNPAPGGGISNAQTFTINTADNPVPTTTSLDPSSQTAGSAGFTLTVNGSDFVSNSVVRWNGADRTTIYGSSTQVTATISAADIASAGTATVTVFNPAPGGGISNTQAFMISTAPTPTAGPVPILWHNTTSGMVYGMTTDGTAVTGGAVIYTEPDTTWSIVGQGDFDGDGIRDYVWWNSGSGQVYLMHMASATTIKDWALIYQDTNTHWNIVATGDINNDTKTDLIWQNDQTGQVYAMLINNSTVTGGAVIYTETDLGWKIVGTGDFSGTGRADLLYWNSGTGQTAIVRTAGLNPASGTLIYTEPDTNWKLAGIGDLDGDGKADIVWHNKLTGKVYGMLMNDTSIANSAVIYTEPNTHWEIASIDKYAAGNKAGLLWKNTATGQVYLMPMNGLSVLAGSLLYTEPDLAWCVEGATEWRDNLYGPGITTTTPY